MADRVVTPRRTLEQIVHTAQEALSVIERGEDINCCLGDLYALQDMTTYIIKHLLPLTKPAIYNTKIG
jgi:hypothetical protein